MASRLCGGGGAFLDRSAHQVAPLGPRTVVVGDVVVAEQIFQNKPCVAGALADAAIGDHRLGTVDAFAAIERAQLVRRFESAIVVARLTPWNVARVGNVAAALAGLGKSGRSENFA